MPQKQSAPTEGDHKTQLGVKKARGVRRALELLAATVIGFAVTIAIAWLVPDNAFLYQLGRHDELEALGPSATDVWYIENGIGYKRRSIAFYAGSVSDLDAEYFVNRAHLPVWSAFNRDDGITEVISEEARGWPFLAMRSYWLRIETGGGATLIGAIRIGEQPSPFSLDDRTWLWPTIPIWTGLAINVIIYGGVFLAAMKLLAALWATLSQRRRPRKGHCKKCGYDLRGLEGRPCPECGNVA